MAIQGDRFKEFRHSIHRHGLRRTGTRSFYKLLCRVVQFEWCRVASDEGGYDWTTAPEGYETRRVSQQEFNRMLCDELKAVDYDWAFERGDFCIANIQDGEIVGYSFSSLLPTRVQSGLVFKFPDGFMYGFSANTAAPHRGKKLQRESWKVRQAERLREHGSVFSAIWYINITNLESLASVEHSGVHQTLRGYAGYVRFFGRWITFASPGCKRLGVGFARNADSEA